ncbi:hypothetical protein MKX01_005722 [Papaver californicum]|nr:hypothetical protein MKX01_005722 [Papaver californicum]
MDSEVGQSVSKTPQNPSCSGSDDRNVMANFNCNICLDVAQDPIWFQHLGTRSLSQECPVCKALVQEEKLVPLYGKGKTSADDPRLKSIPGIDIPNRPAAQRPETAPRPAPNMNQFPPLGFVFMGVDTPMANVAATNSFTFSTTFTPFSVIYQVNTTTPSHPTSQRRQDIAKNILLLLGVFVIL